MTTRSDAPRFGLLLGLLFAFLVGFAASSANAQRVSLSAMDAKLNQLVGAFDPSRHVTLSMTSDSASTCTFDRSYRRIALDGSYATSEFVVPDGHTLILNDVSWEAAEFPTAFVAGRTLRMSLLADDPNGGNGQIVYRSSGVLITTANENARLGETENLAAGVAIGEGRIVCPSAFSADQFGGSTNTVNTSILRGFLVPNQ